jgi:transcription elongation factor GreA
MSERLIVTRTSLQNLAERHDLHEGEKRKAQREAKVAKEWGDLSENAEYKASKEKFRQSGRLQQRIVREFKNLESAGYVVVDPMDWTRVAEPLEEVRVGVVAKVKQGRLSEEYLLVGAKDQHLPMDLALVPVPYTSPLGRALMGRKAPARIEADIAGEKRVVELLHLRVPTVAEILDLFPELTPEGEGELGREEGRP